MINIYCPNNAMGLFIHSEWVALLLGVALNRLIVTYGRVIFAHGAACDTLLSKPESNFQVIMASSDPAWPRSSEPVLGQSSVIVMLSLYAICHIISACFPCGILSLAYTISRCRSISLALP